MREINRGWLGEKISRGGKRRSWSFTVCNFERGQIWRVSLCTLWLTVMKSVRGWLRCGQSCPIAAISAMSVFHLCPRWRTNHSEPRPAALNLHPVGFAPAVCSQFQKSNKSVFLFFSSIPAWKSLPTEKSICWPQTDQRANYGAQAKMYVYANQAVITEADQPVFSPWLKGSRAAAASGGDWASSAAVYQQTLPHVSHTGSNWSAQPAAVLCNWRRPVWWSMEPPAGPPPPPLCSGETLHTSYKLSKLLLNLKKKSLSVSAAAISWRWEKSLRASLFLLHVGPSQNFLCCYMQLILISFVSFCTCLWKRGCCWRKYF